jgi:hypothetical protein
MAPCKERRRQQSIGVLSNRVETGNQWQYEREQEQAYAEDTPGHKHHAPPDNNAEPARMH